jgi:hypothetical protein
MWRPAVQPYLEQVAEALADKGRSEHSVFVDIADVRVLLTPFEQELVLSMGEESGSDFARRHILVRDCVGLRVKILTTLSSLEKTAGGEAAELRQGLAADVDLGCELMHELTLEMKEITASGELGEAKDFSQYRKQLLLLVERAERKAQQEAGDSDAEEAGRDGRQPARGITGWHRRITASTNRKGSRVMWVVLALVAAFAAAVLVTLYLKG